MSSIFATRPNAATIPIAAIAARQYKDWLKRQPKAVAKWLDASEFKPSAGKVATVPAGDGSIRRVVLGLGDGASIWSFAALPGNLPRGRYQIDTELNIEEASAAALGWALAHYRFDRYKKQNGSRATLVWPDKCDRAAVERTAEAICLARDLINTPAADMGPAELAAAAEELASRHGAKVKVVKGKALSEGYPAIAAVGAGSSAERAPRLIDLTWGSAKAPRLTLVGKGIVFDTGGLDLKPAQYMRLMKKDMGGAAAVLALAHMVMGAKLPVRLRVLIAAAENSISADAYRPGDILHTKKGLTVEVGNTDAEGRIVLCDALAEGDAEKPDLLIDLATLTGAARVALGNELPAVFSTDIEVANALIEASSDRVAPDPLWRLPLFDGYRRHLDSPVADLCNIDNVGKGGAITAALFLKEFVSKRTRWVHIDTLGWNMDSRPGRPSGGEALGVRAIYRMLERRYAAE